MATFCPYCDEEIEAAINKEWGGDYWTFKEDFECPKCHKKMTIDVEAIPNFIVTKNSP